MRDVRSSHTLLRGQKGADSKRAALAECGSEMLREKWLRGSPLEAAPPYSVIDQEEP